MRWERRLVSVGSGLWADGGSATALQATTAPVDHAFRTGGRSGPDVSAVAVEAASRPRLPSASRRRASSRPGTGAAVTGADVEPDIVPITGSGVQVLAAADRAFTASPSPPAGLVAGA